MMSAEFQTFRQDRLLRLADIEDKHFWFVARRQLINFFLKQCLSDEPSTVLEIGCGTGRNLKNLVSDKRTIVGLDRRPEGLQQLGRMSSDISTVQADATAIPLASGSVNLVLALDVLEHLEDSEAFAEMERVLKCGGFALITVPAFQFLWSYRDDDAGHLRRYSKSDLLYAINQAKLSSMALIHYQFFLLPLVILSRFIGRRKSAMREIEDQPPAFLNWLFTKINVLEIRATSWGVRFPWGSTLVALVYKPKPTEDGGV